MREQPLIEQRHPPGGPSETEPMETARRVVESTLADSVMVSTQEEAEEAEDEPVPPPKGVFVPNWSSIIACLLFVLLVGEHVVPLVWSVLDSFVHPKATITLFAAKQPLTLTYSFLAVTGTADLSQNQVTSRILTATTPTRSVTLPTTGLGYTPAVQAKGEVTFYNEAPYPQSIPAGTVLTGRDGVQVITDEIASIGAGNAPTFGMASVSAHALLGGTRGNIAALDVNGLCCVSGIAVKNNRSFTGGLDPQSYLTVSRADVQTAAKSLAGILDPQARNGLQRQLAETERVLTAVQCSSATTSTPTVGERATQALVSVSETCTTQVIDYRALQEQTRLRFEEDAAHTLPWAVLQANRLSLSLAPPRLLDSRHHTYRLAVTAAGTMVFHLTEPDLHKLRADLAGQPLSEAQHALLAIKGVQGVSITPAHPGESRLPADPSQIQIIIA